MTQSKFTKSKLLAILLCLVMALQMLPLTALAAEPETYEAVWSATKADIDNGTKGTLAEAINAVNLSDATVYIKLLSDVSVNMQNMYVIEAGKSADIDLNGKSITSTTGYLFRVMGNASLTVYNGTVSALQYAFQNYGTLTVDKCNVSTTKTNAIRSQKMTTAPSVKITNSTIEASATAVYATAGSLEIEKSDVTAKTNSYAVYVMNVGTTVTVKDTDLSANSNTLYVQNGATATLSGEVNVEKKLAIGYEFHIRGTNSTVDLSGVTNDIYGYIAYFNSVSNAATLTLPAGYHTINVNGDPMTANQVSTAQLTITYEEQARWGASADECTNKGTLAEAIAAVNAASAPVYVKLYNKVTTPILTVDAGKTAIIDLNGKSLWSEAGVMPYKRTPAIRQKSTRRTTRFQRRTPRTSLRRIHNKNIIPQSVKKSNKLRYFFEKPKRFSQIGLTSGSKHATIYKRF